MSYFYRNSPNFWAKNRGIVKFIYTFMMRKVSFSTRAFQPAPAKQSKRIFSLIAFEHLQHELPRAVFFITHPCALLPLFPLTTLTTLTSELNLRHEPTALLCRFDWRHLGIVHSIYALCSRFAQPVSVTQSVMLTHSNSSTFFEEEQGLPPFKPNSKPGFG